MDISISLVTYKTSLSDFHNVCRSVLNTSLDVRLVIVDNSPFDDLRAYCTDPRITYIFNPSNPGFGAGHNLAIKSLSQEQYKYHLVVNPDVYFEAGTLERIVDFMDKNESIGNLMPKVIYPNGTIQYLCKLLPTPYDWIGRRFNPIKTMVEKRNDVFELRFTKLEHTMEVPYLSGCFMFLRKSIFQQVGLFDEGIFMYGEETDLGRRIINRGYKNVYFPDAVITHHFQKGSHKSWRLTWIGIKSAIYYFNKWGWFYDTQRDLINEQTLKKLNHRA